MSGGWEGVRRFDRASLLGRTVYTLVDLYYAGMTIRLSTDDLDVESEETGEELHYHGVLDEVALEEALDLFQTGATPVSVQVTGVLPVNLPKLVAEGHDIACARADISRWIDGTDYSARRVVIGDGRITNPEHGGEDEPLNCSVEQEVAEDTSLVPDIRAEVSNLTWDVNAISHNDLGRPYPIIIGRPGISATATGGWITGSQALWVSKQTYWHKLLVAGHPVEAATVWINQDDVAGVEVAVTRDTDGAGRTVSVIDYAASGYDLGDAGDIGPDYQPAVAEDVSIFVGWKDGGGIVGPDGTAIRRAGDVLEWALSQLSIPVDQGKMGAAKPLLNQYLIDCTIDGRTSLWAWLQGVLLPLLPVSIVVGARGVYPIVWRHDAVASDAVATLDVTPSSSIQRVGAVRSDNSQIKNDFKLDFAYSTRTSTYTETATLGVYRSVHATAKLRGFQDDRILLTATAVGERGAAITVTSLAAGALSVTEDTEAKTIVVEYNDGVSTTQDVIDEINSVCTSVTARSVSGVADDVWNSPRCDYEVSTHLPFGVTSAHGSSLCEVSQSRWGVRTEALKTVAVYDSATAALILAWKARAHAFPRRRVDYLLPESEWAWLDRGCVVVLNDEDLYVEGQVCLVESVQSDDSGLLGVRLLLVEDPARDHLRVAS